MNRTFRRLRVWAVAPAMAALLMPADALAIFGCLQKRYDAAAALYGGTVCTPQGQQLVCNYVPQTCYRTQVVQVPVTTYRPVTSCDPCTGCQTVCMRPQVCYQQQVKYVPYTSYRLQYSLQQPACATTATTYYAPTAAVAPATFLAPAAGCSSCNSGAATTTYYAPAVVAPSVVKPTTSYMYPTAPAGLGGYNYAPGATNGIAQASGYASGAAPGYADGASLYGGAATYSAPATYAAPAVAAPAYSAPATPTATYSQSAIVNPAPSLNGGSTAAVPSTGSPAVLSSPSTSTVISGGGLTPVPASTFAAPNSGTATNGMPSSGVSGAPTLAPTLAPSTAGSSSSSYPAQPATDNPPAHSPYSSGVAPSTGSPTPVPALNGANPAVTPMPTPTPSSSRPPVIPMPDPEMSGPRFGTPTSTPRLIDPEDKTAARWPTRRTYGYREVPAMFADRADDRDVVTTAAFVEATPMPAVAGSQASAIFVEPSRTTLGAPQAVATPAVVRDRDGWISSGR